MIEEFLKDILVDHLHRRGIEAFKSREILKPYRPYISFYKDHPVMIIFDRDRIDIYLSEILTCSLGCPDIFNPSFNPEEWASGIIKRELLI